MSAEFVLPHTRSTQQQPVTQVDLSFDEVANLFPFPIAEAASTLGVSTNDLKRVCRENGLNRWPYRKILAGKTVEDVKKEAAREMAILERMSRLQPQSTSTSINALRLNRSAAYNMAAGSVSSEKDRPSIDLSKRQPAGPDLGLYAHASSLKPLYIDQQPQLHNQFQLRVNIPTYLDEFRQGFPTKGLFSMSTHWWGASTFNEADHAASDNKREHIEVPSSPGQPEGRSTEDQGADCIDDSLKSADASTEELSPATMLTRTRKHAVESGRKALGIALTRGYGAYRLADKDEALLRALFAETFPSIWDSSIITNQHVVRT